MIGARPPAMTRRKFLGTATLAFLGLQRHMLGQDAPSAIAPFGPLIADPARILDLPEGFTYRILARQGTRMSDGFKVPGWPDGMAAFPAPQGRLVLVCNHELSLKKAAAGPFDDNTRLPAGFDRALCYDPGDEGESPLTGGTTNLVFDPATGETVSHFLSLVGTERNCAGGEMPWGAWITCEEPDDLLLGRGLRHGWCFEVKATTEPGVQKPVPLEALGRFRHEAVALDPRTGILYLTEDRPDGLLYRFIPERKNDLARGKLQALAIADKPSADLRNYEPGAARPAVGERMAAAWIDLENIDAPEDDLRLRGWKDGAARFARGEGIHRVEDSFYLCCTDGGPSRRGQIFRLDPAATAEGNDALTLFLQPEVSDLLTNGDNLCAAPWGGIVVCEDLVDERFAPAAHVRCVTPQGAIHTLARNPHPGEFAGGCFSPDGRWFFVNVMASGLTLAVTGPWEKA